MTITEIPSFPNKQAERKRPVFIREQKSVFVFLIVLFFLGGGREGKEMGGGRQPFSYKAIYFVKEDTKQSHRHFQHRTCVTII